VHIENHFTRCIPIWRDFLGCGKVRQGNLERSFVKNIRIQKWTSRSRFYSSRRKNVWCDMHFKSPRAAAVHCEMFVKFDDGDGSDSRPHLVNGSTFCDVGQQNEHCLCVVTTTDAVARERSRYIGEYDWWYETLV